jgi:hypothetical protein
MVDSDRIDVRLVIRHLDTPKIKKIKIILSKDCNNNVELIAKNIPGAVI